MAPKPGFCLWRLSRVPCSVTEALVRICGAEAWLPLCGAEVLFISVAPKPGFPLKSGFRLWRPSLVSCRGARVLFLLSSLSLVSLCGSLVSLCGVAPKSCFLLWRPCLVSFCGASVLRLVRVAWRLSRVSSCGA